MDVALTVDEIARLQRPCMPRFDVQGVFGDAEPQAHHTVRTLQFGAPNA
ncbi:hypothetical protein LFM09_09895 [Lentzea alba]